MLLPLPLRLRMLRLVRLQVGLLWLLLWRLLWACLLGKLRWGCGSCLIRRPQGVQLSQHVGQHTQGGCVLTLLVQTVPVGVRGHANTVNMSAAGGRGSTVTMPKALHSRQLQNIAILMILISS